MKKLVVKLAHFRCAGFLQVLHGIEFDFVCFVGISFPQTMHNSSSDEEDVEKRRVGFLAGVDFFFLAGGASLVAKARFFVAVGFFAAGFTSSGRELGDVMTQDTIDLRPRFDLGLGVPRCRGPTSSNASSNDSNDANESFIDGCDTDVIPEVLAISEVDATSEVETSTSEAGGSSKTIIWFSAGSVEAASSEAEIQQQQHF